MKIVNARYGILVKIQCMEILSCLMDAQCKDIRIFMGDCIVFASKFTRASTILSPLSFSPD